MKARLSRRKLYISAVIYFTNFCFGCILNFFSPLVIAFSHQFDTDIPTVSVIFTVMNVSYLISALSSALVYRYLNRHACLIFLVALASMAILAIPQVTTIQSFYLLGALIGVASGCCDTATMTWIIELWREQTAVFILTQHFAYSLGTIFPPLVLAPYLNQNQESNATDLKDPVQHAPSASNLFVPFVIAGVLMAAAAVLHAILFVQLLQKPPASGQSEDLECFVEEKKDNQQAMTPGSFSKRTVTLVILSCYIIGFYQGVEMTTMQFFSTFCVYSKVALSEAKGAQILFGLSLAFSTGRFLGIFIVMKVPPQFILWINFIVIELANTILYLFGQGSVGMMWVGGVLMGFGCSTVYPSFYAYIERHVHITNGIVAVITVCGGLVAAIYPIIVGNYIQENPSVLNYIIFCSLIVIIFCFAVMHWLTRPRQQITTLKTL